MASRFRRSRYQMPNLRVEQVPSAFSGAVGASRWSNKGIVILQRVPRKSHARSSPHPTSKTDCSLIYLDLDPIRRSDRKWSVYALIAYWFSDAFNAATWEFASSILAIGLSYKDAIGIVATGFLIISVVISLNGATGVLYHAPFPVLARAGWGFWGSYGMESPRMGGMERKG